MPARAVAHLAGRDFTPLPSDPLALATALPDLPRWVETRWMLRSGAGRLIVDPEASEGAVVLSDELLIGAVVGRPGVRLLRDVAGDAPGRLDLVVQLDSPGRVREALRGWRIAPATIHTGPVPVPAAAPGGEPGEVVVLDPPAGPLLDELSEDTRRELPRATAVAISTADGEVASVCAAVVVTETMWDVGIDTVEGHRRRGHAVACFGALARHMAAQGKQPVWGAEDDNAASLGLARKLGFRAVDRLAVVHAPEP